MDISPNLLNDFLLYVTPNGNIEVEIFLHNENLGSLIISVVCKLGMSYT